MSTHAEARTDLSPFDTLHWHHSGIVDSRAPATGPIVVERDGVTTIAQAEGLAEAELLGWRFVRVPTPEELPQPEPRQTRPDAPGTLWPDVEMSRAGGQLGQWGAKTALARRSFDASADRVAALIGRPPMHEMRGRARGGPLTPSAVRAADYAALAYLGEALVLLLERVQELSDELAELKAQENWR